MSAGPRFTPLRAEFVDGLRAESAPESAACEHSHRAVCAQTCERNFARTRRRRGQFARKRRIEVLRAKNSVSCGVLHANRASTDGAQRRAPFGCARLFVLPGSAQLFALVSLHAAVRVRQLARRIKRAQFCAQSSPHTLCVHVSPRPGCAQNCGAHRPRLQPSGPCPANTALPIASIS